MTFEERMQRDTKRHEQVWAERNMRRVFWAGVLVFSAVFAASNMFLSRDVMHDVAAASTAALAVGLILRFILR